LRDAAQSVAAENRALKADTSQSITNLTRSVQALCDATTEGMRKDLNAGLDAVTGRVDSLLMATASQVRGSLNDAQQGFREALHAALATITNLHSSANDAITRVANSVGRIEQVQTRIDAALQASSQTRDLIVGARGDIVAASDRMTAITEQLDSAREALADMQQTAATTTGRLAGLTAYFDKLTNDANTVRPAVEALLRTQQETSVRIEALLERAEQVSAGWQHWLSEATRLHQTGAAVRSDLDRLLEQGRAVAAELGSAATAAADQQQRLARELEALNVALERLGRLAGRGLFGRIFGSRV
jgi:chromosome segregation ATPase